VKKRYQMDRESAVRGFCKQAEESEQELQLHLPLKEVAAAVRVCGWRNETSDESRATSGCRNSWQNSPSSTRRLRLRPGRRKLQPAESRSFQRKSGYPRQD